MRNYGVLGFPQLERKLDGQRFVRLLLRSLLFGLYLSFPLRCCLLCLSSSVMSNNDGGK